MALHGKRELDSRDWLQDIADLVTGITGVQLGAKQSAMLETRLMRRIREAGFEEPDQYLDYLRNHLVDEVPRLVALLTTHHTYFFREFSHFQYLEEKGLPLLLPHIEARADKTLKVWSAGCSQGQEVYSLAMFLDHRLRQSASHLKFEILGTDVDSDSIAKAKNGVYLWRDIKQIPLTYLWNHWVRGTEEISDFAKAKASLKSHCRFEVENLQDLATKAPREKFDLIFCRNVLIYFDADQVRQVASSLSDRMHPHGLMFIGLSESLLGTDVPVTSVAPSVYMRSARGERAADLSIFDAKPTAPRRRVRVLCVDDSPTILAILRVVLEPEFEIVGTAHDGIEAAEKISTLQPDLVTLDIHMPRQNGLAFLARTDIVNRPPTVIISSVPREDSGEALRCLELGARDYIEKPDVYSLAFRADEIRSKIRSALSGASGSQAAFEVERAFGRGVLIRSTERKLRLVYASPADRLKLSAMLQGLSGPQPSTLVLIEGARGILPALAAALSESSGKRCQVLENPSLALGEGIYLGDFESLASSLRPLGVGKQVSLVIFGNPSESIYQRLDVFEKSHWILEDLELEQGRPTRILIKAARIAPYTSFAYHSNAYLGSE